jgi:hypothetical protein
VPPFCAQNIKAGGSSPCDRLLVATGLVSIVCVPLAWRSSLVFEIPLRLSLWRVIGPVAGRSRALWWD